MTDGTIFLIVVGVSVLVLVLAGCSAAYHFYWKPKQKTERKLAVMRKFQEPLVCNKTTRFISVSPIPEELDVKKVQIYDEENCPHAINYEKAKNDTEAMALYNSSRERLERPPVFYPSAVGEQQPEGFQPGDLMQPALPQFPPTPPTAPDSGVPATQNRRQSFPESAVPARRQSVPESVVPARRQSVPGSAVSAAQNRRESVPRSAVPATQNRRQSEVIDTFNTRPSN